MVQEALEIANGIHLIEGVRGANSYLLSSGDGFALVDTGLPGNAKKIVEYLNGLSPSGRRLRTIVLTHPDIDHSGSVARLKEITNARVAIHEADAPRLSGEKELKAGKGALGAAMKAFGGVMRFTPVKPDVLLGDGDEIDGLKVVFTPGHTEGSISLYVPGTALFVGDAPEDQRFGETTPSSLDDDAGHGRSQGLNQEDDGSGVLAAPPRPRTAHQRGRLQDPEGIRRRGLQVRA